MDSNMKIGRRIVEKRNYLGVERHQVAAEIGISESELGSIEEGRIEPRKEILYKIAINLGIDLQWLVS